MPGRPIVSGDDTAKRSGRLTLNPIVHLDPLGYLLAVFAFIGWGKPTPVSPWRLRYGPRVGSALVAVAGPLTNLLLAALAAIPWRLGYLDARRTGPCRCWRRSFW